MTSSTMRLQMPTDQWILEELQEGRNMGANISENIDRHKKTVTKRLNQMEDYGLVRNLGNGLYEVTPKGIATLLLIDQYERGEEFENLVEQQAERIELTPPGYVKRDADDSTDS